MNDMYTNKILSLKYFYYFRYIQFKCLKHPPVGNELCESYDNILMSYMYKFTTSKSS